MKYVFVFYTPHYLFTVLAVKGRSWLRAMPSLVTKIIAVTVVSTGKNTGYSLEHLTHELQEFYQV